MKYGLDYIKDAYESCVLFFSYFQISGKYRGKCCRIIRASDYTTKDIYFVAGYIDYKAVEAFCSGTTGKVNILYQQSKVSGATNAIQATYNNMPIIYESGAFLSDGLKFVHTNLVDMSISSYTAISNLTLYPVSIYSNNVITLDNNASYLFSINSQLEYRVYLATVSLRIADSSFAAINFTKNITHKSIFAWKDGGGVENYNAIDHNTASRYLSVSSGNIRLGSRNSATGYFYGNIKTLAIFNADMYANYTELAALI